MKIAQTKQALNLLNGDLAQIWRYDQCYEVYEGANDALGSKYPLPTLRPVRGEDSRGLGEASGPAGEEEITQWDAHFHEPAEQHDCRVQASVTWATRESMRRAFVVLFAVCRFEFMFCTAPRKLSGLLLMQESLLPGPGCENNWVVKGGERGCTWMRGRVWRTTIMRTLNQITCHWWIQLTRLLVLYKRKSAEHL